MALKGVSTQASDRVVGLIVTLAASITVWLVQYRIRLCFRKRDDDPPNEPQARDYGDAYFQQRWGQSESLDLVEHKGSCACGRFTFTLTAPADLKALDCPGKHRYPHVFVPEVAFETVSGKEYLTLYCYPSDGSTIVHAFCSHCGVPICRASESVEDTLVVNVDCLHPSSIRSLDVTYYEDLMQDCNRARRDGTNRVGDTSDFARRVPPASAPRPRTHQKNQKSDFEDHTQRSDASPSVSDGVELMRRFVKSSPLGLFMPAATAGRTADGSSKPQQHRSGDVRGSRRNGGEEEEGRVRREREPLSSAQFWRSWAQTCNSRHEVDGEPSSPISSSSLGGSESRQARGDGMYNGHGPEHAATGQGDRDAPANEGMSPLRHRFSSGGQSGRDPSQYVERMRRYMMRHMEAGRRSGAVSVGAVRQGGADGGDQQQHGAGRERRRFGHRESEGREAGVEDAQQVDDGSANAHGGDDVEQDDDAAVDGAEGDAEGTQGCCAGGRRPGQEISESESDADGARRPLSDGVPSSESDGLSA